MIISFSSGHSKSVKARNQHHGKPDILPAATPSNVSKMAVEPTRLFAVSWAQMADSPWFKPLYGLPNHRMQLGANITCRPNH